MTLGAHGVDVDIRGAPLGTAQLAVILLHGRDQDPEWMYDEIVARMPGLPVTWVAPAAGGRTWYAGRVHDPLAETLAERDRAADVIDRLADALAAHGHPAGSVVLAGFSQGACLVADHLLRRPRRWAGAVIWTGAAFGPAGTPWPPSPEDPTLAGLPALLTNSDADPWVPLAGTESLADVLRSRSALVDLRVVPDRPHEVADDEVRAAAALLRGLLPAPGTATT